MILQILLREVLFWIFIVIGVLYFCSFPPIINFFIRTIIRVAPTCTLWVYEEHEDIYFFRFCPSIYITKQDVIELGNYVNE